MRSKTAIKGSDASMHIFDKPTYFQGSWTAFVAEQLLYYPAGAARSILLDQALGSLSDNEDVEKVDLAPPGDDDCISVDFSGEGG
jgi:hypothetical protein